MTRVVLSIGSNLGDRLARLQSVVDGLDGAVRALSPVYETEAWGGVEQGPFLNAVLIAEDPASTATAGYVARTNSKPRLTGSARSVGARAPSMSISVTCHDGQREVTSGDDDLTLPHPSAHLRAFVLIPWLAVDPAATLTVAGERRPVAGLLDQMEPADRDGVRLTELALC